VCERCHAFAELTASPIASRFRVLLRAPPMRVLLYPYILSVFCERDRLGPTDRAEVIAIFEWSERQAHRAYLSRPFAVLDAVRAVRTCSTPRRALRARRVPEPRFGARNNLDATDCGKTGRSVVSNTSSG